MKSSACTALRASTHGWGRHLEIGLPWAGRIEAEYSRTETEAQLLTLEERVNRGFPADRRLDV